MAPPYAQNDRRPCRRPHLRSLYPICLRKIPYQRDLILSRCTGLRLFNFTCAWFDDRHSWSPPLARRAQAPTAAPLPGAPVSRGEGTGGCAWRRHTVLCHIVPTRSHFPISDKQALSERGVPLCASRMSLPMFLNQSTCDSYM